MVEIDGSQGEGGGQMLRSALALSVVTGKAFTIRNVRAGREKPGLMRQHLTCVQAAAAISSAKTSGVAVGSMTVTFTPGKVRAGSYHFPIGTAGSTMMVLQAVLPALLRADGASTVVVEGGTHNTNAPSYEFFERALVPLMNRAGAGVTARLERYGFYPAGGGRVVVEIAAQRSPARLEVMERGEGVEMRARALVSRLPRHVAMRELQTLTRAMELKEEDERQGVVEVKDAHGVGNAAWLEVQSEHVTEVFAVVGELGKSAEVVAREVAEAAKQYLALGRPIGEYLADQLMVPLAVLAGGRYTTGPLSEHTQTNAAILAAFGGDVRLGEDGEIVVEALR